jgi:capsular polysaccharide biosynthesis protein
LKEENMEKHQLNPQSHPYDSYEDEIELMDLLRVLWKWKYLILCGTFACAVIVAIISLNMTKVYKIRTVLAPGVARIDANGKYSYIGSPLQIKELIETGALNADILRSIKIPEGEDKHLSFEASLTGAPTKRWNAIDSRSVKVTYETPQIELGIQILTHLNKSLLQEFDRNVKYFTEEYALQVESKTNEYAKVNERIESAQSNILTLEAETFSAVSKIKAKISSKKSEMAANEANRDGLVSDIEKKILGKKSEIESNRTEEKGALAKIENEISSNRSKIEKIKAETLSEVDQKVNSVTSLKATISGKIKQISNLGNRIEDVNLEITRISKNTDLLIEERNKFLASAKNENNILASVMYTNTIQQNIGYLNSLRSTVSNVNHRIFEEKVAIEKIQNDIKNIDVEILDLRKQSAIDIEQLLLDIEEMQSTKVNLQKQTEIANKKIKADINDLQAKKVNFQKQTTYKNQILKSDIEDSDAQIESLKAQMNSKRKKLNAQIAALESQKNFIQDEIKNLEFKKNNVQNIRIVQPPESSLYPVRPKKKLYTLMAGVIGLFLTVFLAFFIEYIFKHKHLPENRS